MMRATIPLVEFGRILLNPEGQLLYELFVSNDETAEVRQLASLLDQPLDRVLMAASLACRLGFAKKKAPPEAAAASLNCSSKWAGISFSCPVVSKCAIRRAFARKYAWHCGATSLATRAKRETT